jgi:hypothetical protein
MQDSQSSPNSQEHARLAEPNLAWPGRETAIRWHGVKCNNPANAGKEVKQNE